MYEIGMYKFLGNSLISRIHNKKIQSVKDLQDVLKPRGTLGLGKWVDVAGLICPLNALEQIFKDIEKQNLSSIEAIHEAFKQLHQAYYDLEWEWGAGLFEKLFARKVETLTPEQFIELVEKWKDAVTKLDKMLYDDAHKEFSLSCRVGFGHDGSEEERNLDFAKVRGSFDSNSTVMEICEHIERKTALGNRVIEELKALCS